MSAELFHAEAERTVLGAVLVDNAAMACAAGLLITEHFGKEPHRTIYRAMLRLFEQGSPIDTVTLADELQRAQSLEAAGGPAAIAGLVDGLPRITNVEQWANMIIERAKRRGAFRLAERLLQQSRAEDVEIDRTLDSHLAALSKLLEDGRSAVSSIRDIVPASFKRLDEFLSKPDGIIGVPTGIEPLDQLTAGMRRGSLWILGGRPGRGKSTLCAQAAVFAGAAGFKSLVFSMEMPPTDVVERLLLSEAGVNKWRLRHTQGQGSDEWGRISKAVEKLKGLPVWFDRRESPTLAQVRAAARQQQGSGGLDLIVIDHALRIARDPKLDNWLAIGNMVQGLKNLALGLDVPVLVAYQLTASEEEKRPSAKDLAQSKQVIESECDVLAFLHPDKPAEWRKQDAPDFWLYIDKHRQGHSRDIALTFDKPHGRFRTRDGGEQQEVF